MGIKIKSTELYEIHSVPKRKSTSVYILKNNYNFCGGMESRITIYKQPVELLRRPTTTTETSEHDITSLSKRIYTEQNGIRTGVIDELFLRTKSCIDKMYLIHQVFQNKYRYKEIKHYAK